MVFIGLFSSITVAQEGKASSQIDGMLDGFLGGALGGEEITPEQLAAIDEKVFLYVYDPNVTAEIQGFWATTMVQNGVSQADADTQSKLFNPESSQEWVDSVFVNTGFQANNIVDVAAMEIILDFVIAQQLQNGTPYEGDVAIRDMFKVSSSDSGIYKSFSDRDKQFFVESTLLKLMITIGDYSTKVQNGGDLQSIVEKAHYNLADKGIDSRMVMITESGIALTNLMDKVLDDTMTTEEAFPKEFVFDPTGAAPIPSEIFDSNLDSKTSTETNSGLSTGTSTEIETETSTEITQPSQTSSTDSNPLSQTQTTTNPLAAVKEASPFIGSFSGDGLVLTLTEIGEGFTGELNFNGQVFPVEATGTAPNLTGSFGPEGGQFPFTATLVANILNFDSQGNVFTLEKENANPLGN